MKKTLPRVKKVFTRLESPIFSSSMRSTSEDADFSLVINQLLEGQSIMATAKKPAAKKAAPCKESCSARDQGGSC